ncbi:hypothetical protein Q1695_012038 [Nippostrongylus brasiliensis]|nr:hypothetical protein Q1695_012038 [Nippostrongylus brasiliensis]
MIIRANLPDELNNVERAQKSLVNSTEVVFPHQDSPFAIFRELLVNDRNFSEWRSDERELLSVWLRAIPAAWASKHSLAKSDIETRTLCVFCGTAEKREPRLWPCEIPLYAEFSPSGPMARRSRYRFSTAPVLSIDERTTIDDRNCTTKQLVTNVLFQSSKIASYVH